MIKNNLNKKIKIVETINNLANKSVSVIFLDLLNVNSNDLSYIRRLCHLNNCIAKISKKTLLLKGFKSTQYENLILKNKIPTSNIIIFSFIHIGYIARLLINNKEIQNSLIAKMAFTYDTCYLSNDLLFNLSQIPTKHESIRTLVHMLKQLTILNLKNVLLKINN